MSIKRRPYVFSAALLGLPLATGALAAESRGRRPGTPEERTAARFEALRNSPPQLLEFLLRMPKGGDLHTHLSGAAYAESYVRWAAAAGLCFDPAALALSPPPCDTAPPRKPAS